MTGSSAKLEGGAGTSCGWSQLPGCPDRTCVSVHVHQVRSAVTPSLVSPLIKAVVGHWPEPSVTSLRVSGRRPRAEKGRRRDFLYYLPQIHFVFFLRIAVGRETKINDY